MTEPETAGIVSRGVAAVIDLVVVGAVIGLLYLGLVLSRLLFNPTGLLSVAVDRRRRSVQDILLGTRVVYVRR